jgi:hypothetical protein
MNISAAGHVDLYVRQKVRQARTSRRNPQSKLSKVTVVPLSPHRAFTSQSFRTMISRSAIRRNVQLAIRGQVAQPSNRRTFAAAATGATSFSYETADIKGVKVASRDVAGRTTKLAVVAKAGTRYQPLPGLTVGLEQFAFKVRRKDLTPTSLY